MYTFDEAFEISIGNEGGYVNDPDDAGGETKFGISKRVYPDLDINNLTLEDAKRLYYNDFWDTKACNMNRLPSKVAIEVFDTGINMGMTTAFKMLQEALNLLNQMETKYPDLVVDGIIGDMAIYIISKVEEHKLLKCLNGLQFCRYLSMVEHSHSREKFFASWIERT
jgi:lysozyme family protein